MSGFLGFSIRGMVFRRYSGSRPSTSTDPGGEYWKKVYAVALKVSRLDFTGTLIVVPLPSEDSTFEMITKSKEPSPALDASPVVLRPSLTETTVNWVAMAKADFDPRPKAP